MSESEQWIRWEPIQGLTKKYYVDSIVDNVDSLCILLSSSQNSNERVRLVFEDGVESYKMTEETYTFKTIDFLDKQYGTAFYTQWTFFKIINSSYLHLLSEQSYEISASHSLIHFSILAVDSMIDIISVYEPKVIIENGIRSS